MTTILTAPSALRPAAPAPAPDARAARRALFALGALTLVAFALRLYRLNHSSLWMDEVLTMARADPEMSWRDFFHFPDTEPHPVWHHGLLRLWLTAFGYGEFQGRLLSAILGTLAIPATYLLARSFAGPRGSLFAALAAALSWYLIFYSQELVGYANWFLFACLSYWLLFAFCRKPSLRTGAAYTLATLIALHIHFHAAFMIAAQFAAALYLGLARGGFAGGFLMALRLIVPGLVFLVSLAPMADMIGRAAERGSFIKAAPGGGFAFEYFYGYFGSNIVLAVLVGLPVALALLGPLQRWFADAPARAPGGGAERMALLLLLVVGLGVPYLVSVAAKPLLFHRYTMYAVPLYFALMAIGFDMIAGAGKRWAYAGAVAVASLWVLLVAKDHYSVTVKLDQPRELVAYVAKTNAERGIGAARYVSNHPALIHFYMRANGIRAPILAYAQKEEIPARLGPLAKGELFWLVTDGWDLPSHIVDYVAARYEKLAEVRLRRGYAGLYRAR